MSFAEAVAALDARTNYERAGVLRRPTLDRMRALMDLLAEPQRGFSVVHVTGTNGKTTVAHAAAAVVGAAGLRVGTYTSPHVQSICERVAFDGEPISEDDFARAWSELEPYLELADARGDRISWFEAVTALAFTWFADRSVDVAVLEVGMGGTWDATNVADADVCAISRIGLDHRELGATPAEVAGEKAGIVKRGSAVYSVRQPADALDVLRARCDDQQAELIVEGAGFELETASLALGGQSLRFRLGDDRYDGLFLPMFGEHFARDAVLGAAAGRAMLGGVRLDEDLLAEAFVHLRVPGRLEVVRRAPLVVLDGAHNADAASALASAMTSSFSWDRLVVVVSIMKDKDVEAVLRPLLPLASEVIATQNESPRAMDARALADRVRAQGVEVTSVADVADAISVAMERAGESDCILVTGSLYTVGEARSALTRSASRRME